MPAAKPPTTTLAALTEAVLGAVVTGAARANEVSRSLVAGYAKDEALRMLGVPAVEVQELTVTLRFVAVAPVTGKGKSPDLVVSLDPSVIQKGGALQELTLQVGGRSRPVIDIQDPKDPKRRTHTLE